MSVKFNSTSQTMNIVLNILTSRLFGALNHGTPASSLVTSPFLCNHMTYRSLLWFSG